MRYTRYSSPAEDPPNSTHRTILATRRPYIVFIPSFFEGFALSSIRLQVRVQLHIGEFRLCMKSDETFVVANIWPLLLSTSQDR